MWQANKGGIIALLVGGAILGGIYLALKDTDKQLADQIVASGICLLLFGVAVVYWVMARRGM